MGNMDSILGSWMWQLNCQWVSHLHLEDRHSDICPLAKDWLFYLATLHFPMSVWLKPCSSSPIRKTTHHSLSHTHYACGGLRPLPFWDGKERTFRMSHFWYWSSTSFLQQTSNLTCHVSFRASYLLLAYLQTCTKIETQTWPPCDIGNSVTMIHSVQFLAERKRDIWLTDRQDKWMNDIWKNNPAGPNSHQSQIHSKHWGTSFTTTHWPSRFLRQQSQVSHWMYILRLQISSQSSTTFNSKQ